MKEKRPLKEKMPITVYIGDVEKALSILPAEFADCVVTSPPYWKQRDYKHPQQIGQEDSFEIYIDRLVGVFSQLKRVLKPPGTFFLNVGYKYWDKNLLLVPELLAVALQKNGWCLLNKIIWFKPNAMPSPVKNRFSNVYEPVFLFVKEENKHQYYFSLDRVRSPASDFENERKPEDLIGLEVRNSLIKEGIIKRGIVKEVYKNTEGHIFAKVSWGEGEETMELVADFDKESQLEIELICPACNGTVKDYFEAINHSECSVFLLPRLPSPAFIDKMKKLQQMPLSLFDFLIRDYKGKYLSSPESRGASPGARLSLFGEYLVLQRRYKIYQPLICDYLRYWRAKRKIPIKEIDKLLGYPDTAGHWFRKDTGSWGKGGSIPLPGDWYKLKEILQFDDIYDRWVTETHLVLQTVRAHPKGKNPGDMWSIKTQQLPEAHFAIFPEELVRRCIEVGCPEGGVVLDPFAGSGTTGKVALEMGRRAVLIELVPAYLEIIKKRCQCEPEVIYVD